MSRITAAVACTLLLVAGCTPAPPPAASPTVLPAAQAARFYDVRAYGARGDSATLDPDAINRAIAAAFSPRERVDRADRIFASPRLVRFVEMEQAFPREHARAVVEELLEVTRRYPVNFPIEVRFVAGDDALISPAGGRETAYVAVHNALGMPWEPFFRAVQAIGDAHEARPHWGKRHFHTASSLAPRYPEFGAFLAQREAFDPDRRFANRYVERVLGP